MTLRRAHREDYENGEEEEGDREPELTPEKFAFRKQHIEDAWRKEASQLQEPPSNPKGLG